MIDEEIINIVINKSIETQYCRLCHLKYDNILKLSKVADIINVKSSILENFFNNY